MIRIHVGDAISILRFLPSRSARCCVTSPPYYGLRDYGHAGQIGLEATPEEYVARLVAVFGEVRRVLSNDGTLWLNLGDSYAADRGGTHMPAQTLAGGVSGVGDEAAQRGMGGNGRAHSDARALGLKHKDLMGIPWMVAFALRADGWYLRQEIIWHKPNPMPESVRDRCTKSHEHVFLLSKQQRYFFDTDAIAEPAKGWNGSRFDTGKTGAAHPNTSKKPRSGNSQRKHRPGADVLDRGAQAGSVPWEGETANARDVWTIPTRPFPESHFATMPEELAARCIRAGSAPGDTVLDPFAGAGTTLLAARNLDRDAVGIEINPDYAKMARRRTCDIFTDPEVVSEP